jgi:hypothetical protein
MYLAIPCLLALGVNDGLKKIRRLPIGWRLLFSVGFFIVSLFFSQQLESFPDE